MKNIKILLLILSLLIITSCSNDKDNQILDNSSNTVVNNEVNDVKNIKENDESNEDSFKKETIVKIETENKVYDEIADPRTGLKDATNEELDRIILEEIRLLSIPISEYLFFEEGSTETVNIEDVKKSGGMEISRGNIYVYGLTEEYSFLNSILTEEEKLYSFNQGEEGDIFYYTNKTEKEIIDNFKKTYSKLKVIVEKDFKEITFTNDLKEYFVQISLATLESRDDIDNILGTNEKNKVNIILSK